MSGKLCENTVVELKVLRLSDVGAFLDGQTGNTNDDILLHKNQQIHPVQQVIRCGSFYIMIRRGD